MKLPSVTVEFRHLTVKTDALVGSAGIPTVLNVPLQALQGLFGMQQQTVELNVLREMSGVLKPSRMTLLLGPPGCGKSSFLKVCLAMMLTLGSVDLVGPLSCTAGSALVQEC